jgi:hypothetical protein
MVMCGVLFEVRTEFLSRVTGEHGSQWNIVLFHIYISGEGVAPWLMTNWLLEISIHLMALQPKLGLGLCWGSVTIMVYGVRLLASRPTPVNFGGPMIFLLGFTPLAKGSSFKTLETRPPSHSHLLHNTLCIAPGPPRGGWEFGFDGRACRLNTQEAFWYLTVHARDIILFKYSCCVSFVRSWSILFSSGPCKMLCAWMFWNSQQCFKFTSLVQ